MKTAQLGNRISLDYFVGDEAAPGPRLDREAFKLSKPATPTSLSQLKAEDH